MNQNSFEEILKSSLLLEMRGKAFYLKMADQAENSAVKEFFEIMAAEEESHIQVLSDRIKAGSGQENLDEEFFKEDRLGDSASIILSDEIKKKLTGADFETAAISAAISMEERAIKIYSRNAENAGSPEDRALYSWLSNWEGEHLKLLAEIDRDLTEKIWNDNNFWPF